MPRDCIVCGKELEGRQQKYCSKRCRRTHENEVRDRKPIESITCVCIGCGIEYHPKAADRNKYHSRECAFEHKKAKPKETGIIINYCACGEIIKPRFKYCDECVKKRNHNRYIEYKNTKAYQDDLARQRLQYTPKEHINKTCIQCGNPFTTNKWSQICCTPECATKHQKYLHKGNVSRAKRQRVYLRDAYKCQLCGKKMYMDKVDTLGTGIPHPLAPTIDHIIPKSVAKELGWTKQEINAETNLQAAHFICNVRKGNKSANDQLLLFG